MKKKILMNPVQADVGQEEDIMVLSGDPLEQEGLVLIKNLVSIIKLIHTRISRT